ncbi:C1 family peptidase [Phormidium sp. CLA17]|uniref:C1 family peptidase n=1 Tax=Leptolyngbya sp. Cla-17 TaxID=2803751 RepID=UPI0014920494|nr:C1 family peptidase [Leptolyngbya sp. Cla-17]MBM0743837.1 C1 family peptidase [Leptolyngbya sp. Cla-17]
MTRHKVTTLTNRATGQTIKLGGFQPANGKKPPKSQKYSSDRFQPEQLPPRVDLRPYMTAVENQSQLSSCVANSLAGAYEYLAKRANGNAGDVSRLFIYYNARAYEKSTEDAGCMIVSAIQVLQEHGACSEATWAYDEAQVNVQPHDAAYEEARNFLVQEAQEIECDLTAMKSCLAEGFPFAFGLKLFHSFDKAEKRGIVPIPDSSEQGRAEHGWHAMLCVGYSDQSQAFIVRNSWGEGWGEEGYCYVPYSYMTNPEYCQELWAVRAVSDLDFSQGVWVEDDFSVADAIFDLFGDELDTDTESESESVYTYDYVEYEDESSEEAEETDDSEEYEESAETVDADYEESEEISEEYVEETSEEYLEETEESEESTESVESSYEETEEYSEEEFSEEESEEYEEEEIEDSSNEEEEDEESEEEEVEEDYEEEIEEEEEMEEEE